MEWSWPDFFTYLHSIDILRGAWTTVWLTAISMSAGIVLGLFSALLLRLNLPITKALYSIYTTVIRGTPLLVQLVFVYTALPRFGIRLSVAESAILALSVNEGAYVAEIMRAAIDSVHRGQMEAATALGMTYWKAMRVVILPQAARTAAPAIGNQVNSMLKATSLVSVISMEELFRTTQELIQSTFRVLELFSVASIYYLLLTTAWSFIQRWLEAWLEYPPGRSRRDRLDTATNDLATIADG